MDKEKGKVIKCLLKVSKIKQAGIARELGLYGKSTINNFLAGLYTSKRLDQYFDRLVKKLTNK